MKSIKTLWKEVFELSEINTNFKIVVYNEWRNDLSILEMQIVSFVIAQYTQKEIAERLDISQSKVSKIIKKVNKQLQRLLFNYPLDL